MHILYFHQHFSTPKGATGIRSYEMARRLIERGHRVTMVCGSYDVARTELDSPVVKGARRGVIDGIDVIGFPLPYSNYHSFLKRSMTFLKFAMRSARLAMFSDYDLLFATSTPLTAGIPGICMRPFRRKPFVFEVRDLWPEIPRELGVITNPLILKAMSVLEWFSYHAAKACVGLSPGIKAGIERRGIPAQRVAMIPNGCDLGLFKPVAEKKQTVAGTQPGDFVAVFTGAHGIANGLDAVIDAARVLKQRQRHDIKLVMIGEGMKKPGLKETAAKEGLDNCLFLDPMEKTRLAALLPNADLGLMILANCPAFYYGTSPNKFFDYISAGLPVLNNYPGWLADMIGEHRCGRAVPPGDPEAFVDALIELADDPEERRLMGANARGLAEASFGREDLANQMVDLLESVHQDYAKRRGKPTPGVQLS